MVVIDCTDLVIRLRVPPCAALITLATLTRQGYDRIVVTAELIPDTDEIHITDVPEDIARGVWTLTLETDCRCFSAPVFVDVCQAYGFLPEHNPTRDQETPIPTCCVPDLQPDWGTPPVVFGFRAEQNDDPMRVGIDIGPGYGELLMPSPEWSGLRIYTEAGETALQSNMGPVPSAYERYRLMDDEGRTIAEGTLERDALAVNFGEVDLRHPLTCVTYYVELDHGEPAD